MWWHLSAPTCGIWLSGPLHMGYGCQGPYIWDMVGRAPTCGIWLAGPQHVGYGCQGPNMWDMVVRASTCGILWEMTNPTCVPGCRWFPWCLWQDWSMGSTSVHSGSARRKHYRSVLGRLGNMAPRLDLWLQYKTILFYFYTIRPHLLYSWLLWFLYLHRLISFYSKVSHAYTISKLSYIKLNLLNFIHWFLQILCFFYF